jgi:hypothetical protein
MVSTLTMFSQSTYQQVKKDVSTVIDSTVSTVSNVAGSTVTAVKDGANYIDTSTLTNKVYSDVKGIVTGLAKALGVAAERVYHVLTVHYMVQGITTLLLILIGLFFLRWGAVKLFNYCKNTDEGLFSFSFLGVIGGIIIICYLFATLPTTIGMIFNAEYYTINHIFDLIKK